MPEDRAELRPFVAGPPLPPHADKREPGDARILQESAPPIDPLQRAEILARDVFATQAHSIDRLDYAIAYRFAEGRAGGDVIDVYGYDNGSVSFLAADVEGRGPEAAARAAMIKYSLRAYASAGMTVESSMLHLDRAYVENCAFEETPSFASVFFSQIDLERRTFAYCSGGHDIAAMARPEERAVPLPVTAPLVGVFEDQWHLFPQRYLELVSGTVLVLGTDGITEARNAGGAFFGIDGLIKLLDDGRAAPVGSLVQSILDEVLSFCEGNTHDDIALAAVRFH